YGDLDNHIATDSISIELVRALPPTVTIAKPANGADPATEGEYLLVQVNAVDDVGVDNLVLNVANLITGDRSMSDDSYPYEFLVQIPYGQAGKNLELTEVVTDKSLNGTASSVETTTQVIA